MTNAERARAAYLKHFGEAPALLVRAPGRVNLIGEHTDYNDGFVLPCAIDLETVVAVGPGTGSEAQAVAVDFGEEHDRFDLARPFDRAPFEWANYVRGMAAALGEEGLLPASARLAIAGDVPLGSGLSSSASLEIAVGQALVALSGRVVDRTRLAQLAQRAENDFVGCACGIMDQLIATRGVERHALLIDCRTLECREVSMPRDLAVLVVHSGVRHAHADGEYNDRRRECDTAAAHYGVAALRDLDIDALEAGKAGLDDVAYRRARHVVTENARVLTAGSALASGDLAALGRLMAASHASMRDDFEITVPAIDRLVEIVGAAMNGDGGVRMTGGGFGGCVVALLPHSRVDAVRSAVLDRYRSPGGDAPDVFVCTASDGASVVDGTAEFMLPR